MVVMEEALKNAGLSDNEVFVYLSLLSISQSSAKIIIEKTKLHRQLVYDALNSLIEKGLVSFILEGKKKLFKASEPMQIINLFEDKEKEIEKQKKDFMILLPKLESIKNNTREKQDATVYKGNKGIKFLLDDMIREKKEILTIGASDLSAESYSYHLQFNLPKFHALREKNKTPYKILLSEELKNRAKELNKLKYTESRILGKEFTSNSSVNVYGNKVSIILWGSEPFGILITSEEIAKSQTKHFDILWNIAKKV